MLDYKKLKEILEDEDFKSFTDYLQEKEDILNRNTNRIRRFLSSKSDEEIDKIICNFIKWEDKYEEMYYKRSILTSSNIFSAVINYCSTHGIEIEIDDLPYEDFLGRRFSWGDYKFSRYDGQGSFWRIEKDDEIIYQSKQNGKYIVENNGKYKKKYEILN